MKSLYNLLTKQQVKASAPCRIDSGGTWDIKALALPFEGVKPTTINIALNLRTFVVLSPYDEGLIRVSSRGFTRGEVFSTDKIRFNSSFGLFFAAISYFGFHGLDVHISSQSPVKSALGGSSTAMVALINALGKVSVRLGGKKMSKRELLHLAYHIEDSISGGNCGLQDQAAAIYGGVHQWKWRYGHLNNPLERYSLLNRKGQAEFSECILVAYSGKSHTSLRINNNWIKDFLSGRTRSGWIKANQIVNNLARAIEGQNWRQAAGLLQEEMRLRKELTPEALIPITEKLVDQAIRSGCGARFAGAGAGGSVWALGDMENIQRLKEIWTNTLATVRGAKVLKCGIDPAGVK